MLEIMKTLVIVTSLLGATLGQLTITSNQVNYTDGTYYSPFGTRVSLLCQGGSGAMNWQVDGAIQRSDVPDSDASNLVQRTVSNGQELVIKNLANNLALTYFCQDVDGSLPEVQVEIEEGVIITSRSVLSSSTSVTLQWSPVQDASDEVIASCCISSNSTCSSTVTASTTLSTGSVTITGLEEFISYLCSIIALSRRVEITTGSDKPSGPPLNANLSAVNMNTAQLSWNLPSELDRNGLILSYSVQCLGEGIPGDSTVARIAEQESKLFSDLKAFSSYACRVAASTVNGTGPYSAFSNTKTQEGLPGPVVNISVMKLDNNRVDVSWGLPSSTNGNITSYQLKYRSLDGTVQEQTSSTTSVEDRTLEISRLDPGVPYSLVVVASTAAGPGEDSQPVVFFSRELAPSTAVSGVVAERESADVMRVSWAELSLIEARGFPVYNVLYQVTVGRVTRQSVMNVTTTANTTTIGGLEGSEDYSVTVMTSTEGGNGPQSTPVTVSVFVTPPAVDIASTPNPTTATVLAVVVVVILVTLATIAAVVIIIIYKCKTKGLYNLAHTGQYSTAVSLAASRERESLSTEPEAPDLLPPKEPPRPGSIGLETSNGHLAGDSSGNSEEKKDTPDEDELLEAAIDSIVMPNTDEERQYVNLRPSVKAARFYDYVQQMWANSSFFVEFMSLPARDFTALSTVGSHYPGKNRYRIFPYDHTRVCLQRPCDYINASFVTGHNKKKSYIATQGPLPATLGDFWQMVLENRVTVIVMLAKCTENGKAKCAQYWGDKKDQPFPLDNGYAVTLTEEQTFPDYIIRTFSLSKILGENNPTFEVKHFQYTTWPDHGVPLYTASALKFVKAIRQLPTSRAPLVVHCSAGVGRSGTFIAIHSMIERLETKQDLNIYEFMYSMRCDRPFMIQTEEQYIFVHNALCEYLTCGDTSIPVEEFHSTVQAYKTKSDEEGSSSKLEEQFDLLQKLSKFPTKADKDFSDEHTAYNRHIWRFPYQSNCLYVQGDKQCNYVNASILDTYSQFGGAIAAELPMRNTIENVLKLLVLKKIETVVVICTHTELARDEFFPFWQPPEDADEAQYGRCTLKVLSQSDRETHCVYKMEVNVDQMLNKEVLQFTLIHCYAWPEEADKDDEEVSPETVLLYIKCFKEARKDAKTSPMIMCNDGMSRTGAFICITSEMERIKRERSVDVFQTVKAARTQRPQMVSYADLYTLVHTVLQIHLCNFQHYANIKSDLV